MTPTRDRPEAVELCRRWFREQTYPVLEHIVVEGGSQLDNLKDGIEQAAGEVILLADDDDHYSPTWVDRVAQAYSDHRIQAAGQPTRVLYHLRGKRYWPCSLQPLAGTLSFRRTQAARVVELIDELDRPKRILRYVEHKVIQPIFCTRILGLYPPGPGEGLSRKHEASKFPKKDPDNRRLRHTIGDAAMDAFLQAAAAIDERLAWA